MSRIFTFMPDFLLFLLIGFISIVVYSQLSDDIKTGIKNFLKRFGVFIVLGCLWLYFRKQWGLVAENEFFGQMYLATFLLWLTLLIYFGVKSWLYEQRYYTDHAIANNRQGSCAKYFEIGEWVILFIGNSGSSDERFVIPWPWIKEIWVVPKCAVQFIGNQICVLSQLELSNYMEMPEEEISHFIETHPMARWCKDNVYFGLWTEKIKAHNPIYSELQQNLKKSQERLLEATKMLKGKLTVTKQFISDTLGMTEKFKGKDWRNQQPQSNRED
jgi:hypothetical protein